MKHRVTQLLAAFMPVFTGLSLPMVLSSCTEEMRLEQETLSDGNAKVQVLSRLRTPEEAVNIAATAWHLLPIDISSGNQCVAGCGPVAIAMAFAAARRPSSLKLNYVGSEGEVILRWDEILMKLDHNNDCCSSLTYPVHKRIAQLIREIGHKGDAKYGVSLGLAARICQWVLCGHEFCSR